MTLLTEAGHIGDTWVDDVIPAMEFSFEFTPRVFRQWKPNPKGGDVYNIPRTGNLAANTKAASTAWTPEALIDSTQQLVIDKHDVAGFQLEDIAALLSNTDLKSAYQKRIGYALGRNLEVNLAAMPQSFSQIVGTLGVELTYENLLRAWQYLADGGNTMEDTTWLLSPAAIAGLLKQDIVINAMYRGDGKRAVETASVGTLLNAPVIRTNLTRAPSANQSESAIFKRNAIALIQPLEPKIVQEYIVKELSWVIGGHQVYGYVEVDRYAEAPSNVTPGDDWAVLLRTIA